MQGKTMKENSTLCLLSTIRTGFSGNGDSLLAISDVRLKTLVKTLLRFFLFIKIERKSDYQSVPVSLNQSAKYAQ